MSLATESIGASLGTVPFHVKVFVLHGLRVNVCGVPVQVHFSPSKAMLTDHVPSVVPVFLNVIFTMKAPDCVLSTTPPPPQAKQVND
jgi:hypothetical protein